MIDQAYSPHTYLICQVKVNLGESRDDDGYVETKWIDVVVDGTHVYLVSDILTVAYTLL